MALCFAVFATPSFADDDAPVSRVGKYSSYEQASIDAASRSANAPVDPSPEGKIIERVEIVRLEVFEKRDPLPKFTRPLNVFHATSKRYVVAREILLKVGDRYRAVVADETARNLRGLSQLSLVVVTALRGSSPDKVKLLVITKDVWSLRLNWNLQYGAGGLQSLDIEPSERNLAGTQQTGSVRFSYLPESYLFGAGYRVPRLDGRRLELSADANVILNSHSGAPEGATSAVSVRRPLYSTRTDWGYNVGFSGRSEVLRRYVDAQVSTYDAKATEEKDNIPFVYRAKRFTALAGAVRSFGWANKFDIAFGAEMNLRQYRTDDLSAFNPAAVDEFMRKNIPVSDNRVGPYVELRAYTTNFTRVLDVESLGLQEDFRLGYNGVARVYPVARAFGSSRDLLGTYLGAQYTFALGQGLMRVTGETTNEFTGNGISDGAVSGSVRVVSPRLGIGRVIFDGAVLYRYANYLNRNVQLGGSGRLRGFPTNFFVGNDFVAGNLEYRSRPIDIWSVQFAGAAFWDVGDAFNTWSAFSLKQSLGTGVRILFPQFDRIVFRVDVGFPLAIGGALPAGVSPVAAFVSFGQAFTSDVIGGTAVGVVSPTGGYLGQ